MVLNTIELTDNPVAGIIAVIRLSIKLHFNAVPGDSDYRMTVYYASGHRKPGVVVLAGADDAQVRHNNPAVAYSCIRNILTAPGNATVQDN